MINSKIDWVGNKKSIYSPLGASSHSEEERELNDYYATNPVALEKLLDLLYVDFNEDIWECACGEGHLSKVLIELGYNVKSSDIVDRGFGEIIDFLDPNITSWNGNIITNPPYKFALDFIEKSLDIIPTGNMICMLLKTTFLEGKKRKYFFKKNPPKWVIVSSARIECAKNGNFKGTSAVSYSWFVWVKGYTGTPKIAWI